MQTRGNFYQHDLGRIILPGFSRDPAEVPKHVRQLCQTKAYADPLDSCMITRCHLWGRKDVEANHQLPVREHHVHQRHFDRLVMLSDGVFAIALTLSAVELKPEETAGAHGLVAQWATPLLVYFLSFFIVGGVWMQHRRVLTHLRHVDTPMTLLTLAVLSVVSLMPVVIRVFLTAASGDSGEGMLIYSLALMANYLCLAASWGYAVFIGKLAPDVPAPRALSWLLRDVFVAMLFGATALFSAHMKIAAVSVCVAGIALRFVSGKLARRAEAAA